MPHVTHEPSSCGLSRLHQSGSPPDVSEHPGTLRLLMIGGYTYSDGGNSDVLAAVLMTTTFPFVRLTLSAQVRAEGPERSA